MQYQCFLLCRNEVGVGVLRIFGHIVGRDSHFGESTWFYDYQVMICRIGVREDNFERLARYGSELFNRVQHAFWFAADTNGLEIGPFIKVFIFLLCLRFHVCIRCLQLFQEPLDTILWIGFPYRAKRVRAERRCDRVTQVLFHRVLEYFQENFQSRFCSDVTGSDGCFHTNHAVWVMNRSLKEFENVGDFLKTITKLLYGGGTCVWQFATE